MAQKFSSSARSSYTYKPLNTSSEIRLLNLLHGEPNSPITCTMQACHSSSTSLYPYIALSYAWGRVETSKTITVDDQQLAVSTSVFDALQSLRHLSSTDERIGHNVRIWIDAVCINQADTTEKTSQVRMMHDIYNNATSVVAWLGTETEAESRGFSLIEHFVEKLGLADDNPIVEQNSVYGDIAELAESRGLPHVNHEAWEDVVAILLKPWFGRVWVIQESSCARELLFLCGTDLYSSNQLFSVLSKLSRMPWLQHALRNGGSFSHLPSLSELENVSIAGGTLGAMREIMQRGNRGTLSTNLSISTKHKATDPRDKIFALVPISRGIDESVVDYTLSLPQVLLMAARHRIENEQGSLDILSDAQTFGRLPGVPSWVPCWSEDGDRFIALTRKYSAILQNLPNRSKYQIEVEDGTALCTTGWQVDRIASLHPFKPKTETVDFRPPDRASVNLTNPQFIDSALADCLLMIEGVKWRFEVQQKICNNQTAYPTGQPIDQIFWRSIIQDDSHVLSDEVMACYINEEKEAMDKRVPLLVFLLLSPVIDSSAGPISINQANEAMELYNKHLIENKRRAFAHDQAIKPFDTRWNHGRVLALTEKGFVAHVPDTSKVGDRIYILEGTRIPLLLRPHDGDETTHYASSSGEVTSEDQSYVLIGDVYLHGCMSGPVEELLKQIPGGPGDKHRIRIL